MVQGSPAFKLPSLGQNHTAFGSRFGKKQKSAIRLHHLAASFWQYTSLGMVFLEELDFLGEALASLILALSAVFLNKVVFQAIYSMFFSRHQVLGQVRRCLHGGDYTEAAYALTVLLLVG